jgi:hypothetical protein
MYVYRHTSICETKKPDGENTMSTCDCDQVHPIVVIKVDGVGIVSWLTPALQSLMLYSKAVRFIGEEINRSEIKVEMFMA